jgi:hypothetical protein
MDKSKSQSRRPLLLWLFVLWLLVLAATAFWRAATLWQARDLLVALDSTLSAPSITLFVTLYVLSGGTLIASIVGLWQRQKWGRISARAIIVLYMVLVQAYTWLYVRTGLLWERRWVALGVAIGAVGIAVGLLSWRKSWQRLGIR